MYHKHKLLVLLAALLAASVAARAEAGPAEDQYDVAAGHYTRGQWRQAAQEFRSFLDQYAGHERALTATFFLGESLVQAGRYDQAREHFLRFFKQSPEHQYAKRALFRAGETAYLSGKKKGEALRDLEQFARRYPQDKLNAYVLVYLGDLALESSDAPKAQRRYQQALTRFADGPLARQSRFGMGRALQEQGDVAAAARHYRELAGQKKEPLADRALLRLGLIQYNQQQYAEAAKTLGRFTKSSGNSKLADDALYWLGMTHIARKNWDTAAQILDRAVTGHPKHRLAPSMVFYSGEALQSSGKLDEAAERFERLIHEWPDSQWADDSSREKIQIAFRQGGHKTVDALAAKFQQSYPNSPLRNQVEQTWGRSLLKQEKFAEAQVVFEGLLERLAAGESPKNTKDDSLRRSSHYLLALAYLGGKRFQQALTSLDAAPPAAEQQELAAGASVARASALIGLGKYAEAIAPLRAYLAAKPDGPDAAKSRAELAVSLAHTGQLQQAQGAYRTYIGRHPGHAQMLQTTQFLAEKAYSDGDRRWARELFTVLAREGNPAEHIAKGLSGLAWSQLKTDDASLSAATFDRLLKEYPDSKLAPEAAVARAHLLVKLKRHDAALSMYQLVFDKYAQSNQMAAALLGAARVYDQLGENQQAATLLERLVKQHPEMPKLDKALYRWAWVLVDLKLPEQSDAVFLRIHNQWRQSEFWTDATYRLAQRAAEAGNFQQARDFVAEILQAEPQGEILAHTLFLEGQVEARAGRWAKVARPMERLLTEFPQTPLRMGVEYWIAEAAYRQQQYEEAGKRFDQLARQAAGRQQPWLAMIPLRQAQVLAQRRNWTEAYDLAKDIAGQFPDFSRQYEVDYLLGRCLASQAKFTVAREAYQRVINSAAGGKTETAAMAQWMAGETYFHQKRYDDAIRAYARVEILYSYPRWQAGALLQTGKCYEMKGQWKQAVERYAQLLKNYPKTMFDEEARRRLRVARQRATSTAAVPR